MNQFFLEINNVLIIDDDDRTTTGLRQIVDRSGYKGFVASSWAGALVQLAASNIDVIFCDLLSPRDFSGEQVLQLVQLHYPNIRVVLMANNLSDAVNDRLIEKGASYCIEKPVFEDEYQEVMLHLDEQQFFQSPGNEGFSGRQHGG